MPFHAFLFIVLCEAITYYIVLYEAITYISRGYHVYTLLALTWPLGHGTLIYIYQYSQFKRYEIRGSITKLEINRKKFHGRIIRDIMRKNNYLISK